MIPEEICDTVDEDDDAITYHHNGEDELPIPFSYMMLCTLFGESDPNNRETRFFVTAKKGTFTACWGNCGTYPIQDCPLVIDSTIEGGAVDEDTPFLVGGEAVTTEVGGCVDTNDDNTVDSFGTGCEWYDEYPEGCGLYDVDDVGMEFVANDICCSCGGGATADS